MSERAPGGFAAAYQVLSAFEDSGRCRRGYFVEGLGAAQFGTVGAIDRLRTHRARPRRRPAEKPVALALAATDPANPYGAALPWPPQEAGHRPGRKAGAIVVLVDGELTLYVERGGKTLLTFRDDEDELALGIEALGRRRPRRRAGSARSSRRPTARASWARTPRCSGARWSRPASSPPRADSGCGARRARG